MAIDVIPPQAAIDVIRFGTIARRGIWSGRGVRLRRRRPLKRNFLIASLLSHFNSLKAMLKFHSTELLRAVETHRGGKTDFKGGGDDFATFLDNSGISEDFVPALVTIAPVFH